MGPMWDMCHHLRGWKSKDIDKGNPKRANNVLTYGNEDIPLDFGPKNSVGRGKGEKEKKEKGEEGIFRERSSSFSLEFSAIELLAFVGARDKIDPHSESYAWVPESESFDKLQEVGVSILLGLFLV